MRDWSRDAAKEGNFLNLTLILYFIRNMVSERSGDHVVMDTRRSQASVHNARPQVGHARSLGGIHREGLLRLV